MVPELTVYMQNLLMRGNRTTKVNADNFSAFTSPNYPYLAEAGLNIRYNDKFILAPDYGQPVRFNYQMDPHVAVLKLFPGISQEVVSAHLNIPGLRGLVLETYGSGNSPITQCPYGSVEMHRYENGRQLEKLGVLSGHDITTEAALAKLMILLGSEDLSDVSTLMQASLRGEMTVRG